MLCEISRMRLLRSQVLASMMELNVISRSRSRTSVDRADAHPPVASVGKAASVLSTSPFTAGFRLQRFNSAQLLQIPAPQAEPRPDPTTSEQLIRRIRRCRLIGDHSPTVSQTPQLIALIARPATIGGNPHASSVSPSSSHSPAIESTQRLATCSTAAG